MERPSLQRRTSFERRARRLCSGSRHLFYLQGARLEGARSRSSSLH